MNTKKIYIASSAEISKELGLIRSMIQKMNHDSVKYQFIRWENLTSEFGKERFQDTYNEIISNCDIIIFVFDKTIGLYNIEEFNNALEEFYRRGAPQILLYVKELQVEESNDSSLNAFLSRIADMGQYYVPYRDYEELANSIGLQLLRIEGDSSISYGKQAEDLIEESIAIIEELEEDILKLDITQPSESLDYNNLVKQTDENFLKAEQIAIEMDEERRKKYYVPILSKHCEFLIRHELYDKSIIIINRLIDVAKSYNKEYIVVAKAYYWLGKAQYYLGDLQKSTRSLQEAISVFETSPNDKSFEVVESYKMLGFAYEQLKDYEKAINCYFKVLSLGEQFKIDSRVLFTIYRNLGTVYRDTYRYEEAIEFYLKALSSLESTEELTEVSASIYCDVGSVLYYQGNYPKAQQYFNKAVEILNNLTQAGISDAQISMTSGSYFAAMGDYDKAILLLNNALEIYEQELGREHPTTISIYNNLAVVYSKQGDYSKSMEYNLKATINRRKQRWDVYLSYSKDDDETARIFEKVLDENGITYTSKYDVVIEEEINGKGISDGINNSEIFIALVSKDYFKEELCTKEFQTAFESKGKDQFPIFIAKREGLPSYIEEGGYTFNIRDLSEMDLESIKERITQVINGLIRKDSITPEQRKYNLEAVKERREGPANYVPHKNDTEVFISYRRKDGRHHARIIELALKLSGCENIFFDFSSIKDGVFNTEIYDAIFSCKDFILVLTPLALKKCSEEGDWVAKEIRYAIKYDRKIIPVVIGDTFNGWPKDFPEDMNCVKDIHQHKLVDDEYFDDSISKLVSRLSATANKTATRCVVGPFYKIKTNKTSRLFIDDEEVAMLEPAKLTKVPLPKGQYLRKVQDCENESVEDESTISIVDCDIVEKVMLP